MHWAIQKWVGSGPHFIPTTSMVKVIYFLLIITAFVGAATANYCKCSDGQPDTYHIEQGTKKACYSVGGNYCAGMGYCETESNLNDACKSAINIGSICVDNSEFKGMGFVEHCWMDPENYMLLCSNTMSHRSLQMTCGYTSFEQCLDRLRVYTTCVSTRTWSQ